MLISHIGEYAALSVAIVLTITALAFEYSAKYIGSLNVNLIRLPLAFLFLTIFNFFSRGNALPTDAGIHQWFWLTLSGFAGFVLGDLFLFKSFLCIGSRFSMLIMTLVPLITAFLGWLILGESLTKLSLFGITLTVFGILLAVNANKHKETNSFSSETIKGILYAFGGAIGQSVGLILSKIGIVGYNAFAASQIRIIAGTFGFIIIILITGRFKNMILAFKSYQGMKGILIGSFFGPFIGVSLSLLSIQYTKTGIASTIMATTPILIIIPSVMLFKQKITLSEIIGAFISVIGIAMFFM